MCERGTNGSKFVFLHLCAPLKIFIFSKSKKDFKREELSVIVDSGTKTHCTFELVWI